MCKYVPCVQYLWKLTRFYLQSAKLPRAGASIHDFATIRKSGGLHLLRRTKAVASAGCLATTHSRGLGGLLLQHRFMHKNGK